MLLDRISVRFDCSWSWTSLSGMDSAVHLFVQLSELRSFRCGAGAEVSDMFHCDPSGLKAGPLRP